MSKEEKGISDRPEAYPKPSETDLQLNSQAEYIDQQPNDFSDKTISDIPASGESGQKTSEAPQVKDR
jgi:hypothetical protein